MSQLRHKLGQTPTLSSSLLSDCRMLDSTLVRSLWTPRCMVILNIFIFKVRVSVLIVCHIFLDYLYFTVPPPTSVIVESDPASPVRPIGSDVTFTCTVELSPAVDVPVIINVQLTNPAGNPLTTTSTPLLSGSIHTSTAMVSSFGRNQSGNYTCTATVSSPFLFFTDSGPQSTTIKVTVGENHIVHNETLYSVVKLQHAQLTFNYLGVYLSLRGTVYANNSIILLNDIGETDFYRTAPPLNYSNNGLQCITDRKPCCRGGPVFYYGVFGHWFFPDGRMVYYGKYNGVAIHRNRGYNDGTINLNHDKNSTAMSPTGLFCCVVPDATDTYQTLCANIGKLIV